MNKVTEKKKNTLGMLEGQRIGDILKHGMKERDQQKTELERKIRTRTETCECYAKRRVLNTKNKQSD